MSNPEVTAVGTVDPAHTSVPPRRRGWIRLVLGILLLAGGIGALVLGILQAVETGAAIEDDAVARGEISGSGLTDPVTFEVAEADASEDFTVYLLLRTDSSDHRDEQVSDTRCVAQLADGDEATIRGSRQAINSTIGDASTVGWFSAPAGPAELACGWDPASITGRDRFRPDEATFVVTPGKPDVLGDGVVQIIAGSFAALLGAWLAWVGWRGKRKGRRLLGRIAAD